MAGQTDKSTHPITSSDTIALITNTVMPAIHGIQGDLKAISEIRSQIAVINTKLADIAIDTKDVNDTIKQFRITLYGNGDAEKLGLVGIVSKLSSWIEKRSKIEIAVIIGATLAVLGEIGGFIVVIIRLQAIH